VNPQGILTEREAAELILNMKPQPLAKWRLRHMGPPFLKLGGRVRYNVTDIQAWMESCRIDPAKQPLPVRKHVKRKRAA
jgi:hypothetical protein